MLFLGIETSCDETAAALVEETGEDGAPWRIRANVVASQTEIHREWGGVVPELASRQHVRDICGVVERALEQAQVTLDAVDAIAVTQGPGLVGSLLVGVSFAKSLAAARGIPLVPVHHLAGHIESLFLHNGALPLPSVVLVVSGGHTSLYLVPSTGVYDAAGADAGRRGRRGVRQGRQAARPWISGWPGHRPPRAARQRPRGGPARDADHPSGPQRARMPSGRVTSATAG